MNRLHLLSIWMVQYGNLWKVVGLKKKFLEHVKESKIDHVKTFWFDDKSHRDVKKSQPRSLTLPTSVYSHGNWWWREPWTCWTCRPLQWKPKSRGRGCAHARTRSTSKIDKSVSKTVNRGQKWILKVKEKCLICAMEFRFYYGSDWIKWFQCHHCICNRRKPNSHFRVRPNRTEIRSEFSSKLPHFTVMSNWQKVR